MTAAPTLAVDGTTDGDLLRAVAAGRDEEAFAELVRRYGPLVLSVCRRVLADRPEADDAFQAVFLVLARKAGTIRRPEQLGNWLYGVALRCARRAKSAAGARRAREVPMPDVPAPPRSESDWSDVRPVLDDEIGRLPDKLRAALVACELQGLDRAAAAELLGVPEGTLSSRLARAKDLLRRRLVRRGLVITAAGLIYLLTQATARAAVPPGLAAAAVRHADRSGACPDPVHAIAQTELTRMLIRHILTAALAVAVLAAVGTTSWLLGPAIARGLDDKKPDQDAIQGKWKLVSAKLMGKDLPEEEQKALNESGFVFEKDKLTAPHPGSFTLDPTKSPKEMDLTIDEPEQRKGKYLAVYELDGDTLKITFAHVGQDRPTKVAAGNDDPWAVLVFERVKK
jgi:RNA polymerase sigma factor (sigma-70 family)